MVVLRGRGGADDDAIRGDVGAGTVLEVLLGVHADDFLGASGVLPHDSMAILLV